MAMDKDTEKSTVTMSEDTKEWLVDTYPDALSLQEAVRMAISDARTVHEYRAVIEKKATEDD